MGFELLPPEIIEKIFSSLDTTSIAICSRVCGKWRNLVVNGTSLSATGPGQIPKVRFLK